MLLVKLLLALQATSAAIIGLRSAVLQPRQDTTQKSLDYETLTWANGSVLDEDFYKVSPGSGSKPAGSLLKAQTGCSPTNYTIPSGLSLSRIIFQSKTVNGTLVPSSAYILWPYTPRKEVDGHAVVAFAHGASGMQADCAPSHQRNLYQHFQAPYPLAYQGYTVVAPDYTGQGVSADADGKPIVSEFFGNIAGANDVFYAVQAAQTAFPELSRRFAIMGHSQGGGIVWAAAQRQALEPVEGYLGAVAIAPSNRYLTAANAALSPVLSYVMLMAAIGAASSYPEFDAEDIATTIGKTLLQELRQTRGCIAGTIVLPGPEDSPIIPRALSNPYLRKYLDKNAVGGKQISGPLLVIQGETDVVVLPDTTVQAVKDTVSKYPASQIEFDLLPDVDHDSSPQISQLVWQTWLADRFAGKEVQPYPGPVRALHSRPKEFLQPAIDWVIVLAALLMRNN
ncbi:MAG: hypothetical protein MMC23_001731 [Stictis urceolatum]|nr:hypothetical protein [Stictis urceolata]